MVYLRGAERRNEKSWIHFSNVSLQQERLVVSLTWTRQSAHSSFLDQSSSSFLFPTGPPPCLLPSSKSLAMVCMCVCACVHVFLGASVVSNSLRPCGPQPTRLLCPWDSSGMNTEVHCHASSRGSSRPRDQTPVSCVSCTAGRFFTAEPLGKPWLWSVFPISPLYIPLFLSLSPLHPIFPTPQPAVHPRPTQSRTHPGV